jgi:indole-3-glycerol phosphate synthase
MTDVLSTIISTKKDEVAALKASTSAADLAAMAKDQSPPRGFIDSLSKAAITGYGLIAEIKKASPSKGVIRADFDPPALAVAYENGGASCLSVLTDREYFQGDMSYMVAARNATSLPVLRKDFMIDPIQVTEARAHGADAILIIMAAVSDSLALELEDAASVLGMDVLVEIHDREELERSHHLASPLLGVNNRNLKTMKTDLATGEDMLRAFPSGRLAVAESGLYSPADLARMAGAGARCFLIGEALMRQPDVEQATRTILASPAPAERQQA